MTESNTTSSLITIVLCSQNPTHPPLSHVKNIIDLILDPTSYVLHYITPNDLITTPWKEYATILFVDAILESSQIHFISEQLHTFQDKFDGIIISLDTNFNQLYKETNHSLCLDLCDEYTDLLEISDVQNGRIILCKNDLLLLLANVDKMGSKSLKLFRYMMGHCGIKTLCEPSSIPKSTFGYLLMRDESVKETLVKSIQTQYISKTLTENDLKIDFISTANSSTNREPSLYYLPVLLDKFPQTNLFDRELYLKHLNTKYLGENIIYTEVTASTIDILNPKFVFSVPVNSSLLVICSIQTKGKGRGSNQWVSPTGCLTFSQLISINANSYVGRHITLLQHIVSIAVVHSIRSLDKYQNLELRLKWPNDIYYKSEHKIGGVLVNNFSMGTLNRCILSVGLNVSTQNLFSLNSAIDRFNKENRVSLPYLPPECILARALSFLEVLMFDLEKGKLSQVLELYYKYWLHSKVEITSWKNPDEKYVIEGLDEYGFLSVTSKIDGRKSTIHPDGNSFDMLNGYISQKV